MLDYFRQYAVAAVFGGGLEPAALSNNPVQLRLTNIIFRRHHDLDNISLF